MIASVLSLREASLSSGKDAEPGFLYGTGSLLSPVSGGLIFCVTVATIISE